MSGVLFGVDPASIAATTDDWYTPRWIFAAAGLTFDLDVAAPVNPEHRTVPARRFLTAADDGLTTGWDGLVWCNPPYSKAAPWVDRWAAHGNGLILLMARPEVRWRGVLMRAVDTFTLLAVTFHRPDGTTARVPWAAILAGNGPHADAVSKVAEADPYGRGAYLIGP